MKQFDICSVYLHRSRLVLILYFIPVSFILLNLESILRALKQDPITSDFAGKFVKIYLPSIFMLGLNDGTRLFLNSFGLSRIPFLVLIVGNVIHIILCQIFVVHLSFGLYGIGMAGFITNLITFMGMNIYPLYIEEIREAIKTPDRRVFNDLVPYLKLGLPISMMLCFEWWSFEVIVLFAGYMGVY